MPGAAARSPPEADWPGRFIDLILAEKANRAGAKKIKVFLLLFLQKKKNPVLF
jgi:hypothetical protein